MNTTNILLRHNLVEITPFPHATYEGKNSEAIATILMNLAYYGYALQVDTYKTLTKLSANDLADWWITLEVELKSVTGTDRKMGDFVVYKNFPAEVLSKSEIDYWVPQILMYWGFPNDMFTEPVELREKMNEKAKAIVLRSAKSDSLKNIFNAYLKSSVAWKDHELADVLFLAESMPVNLAKLSFKENMVKLAAAMMASDRKIHISTATDVLRLAAGLSDGDVSLRTKFKLKSFKKSERRFLLSLLEECDHLNDDMARRPELFKRLIHTLHPGDWQKKFPLVNKAMDNLYKGKLCTFNAKIENLLMAKDESCLEYLVNRPGDFRRRLCKTIDVFGKKAVEAFCQDDVLGKLTTYQIVSLRSYLETVNDRKHRCFPPKGNWNKLQIGEPRKVKDKHVKSVVSALDKSLSKRLPSVQKLDKATDKIKLPSGGSDTGTYTRGTVFPIPNDVEFIRTASYWKVKTEQYSNIWFDNGWNFFDANWKSIGTCCWNLAKFPASGYYAWNARSTPSADTAAVFSGDPTNSKEMEGRACQMIDLYLSKLEKQGVRYAVWNILCYSNIPFSQADDVFAALQWGKEAQTGKLFEPSRCQLSFPLTGENKTKYICLIDVKKRELVYLDANLHGKINSASSNGPSLEKNMPAFMEYIKSLPSVHDLFRESVDKKSDGPVILYSDKDTELAGEKAYVFKPENKENTYKSIDLNALISA